jgi:hypothetical protein
MTKADFLAVLEKNEQVKFTGSTLQAPTPQVCDILRDALMTILPENELVRFGVQPSTLEKETWTGQLVWLLVLRVHLLEVTSKVRLEDNSEGAKGFLIAYQIYPIDGTLRIKGTFQYAPIQRGAQLATSGARISLGSVPFDIKADRSLLTDQGVVAFIAALREAAARWSGAGIERLTGRTQLMY